MRNKSRHKDINGGIIRRMCDEIIADWKTADFDKLENDESVSMWSKVLTLEAFLLMLAPKYNQALELFRTDELKDFAGVAGQIKIMYKLDN